MDAFARRTLKDAAMKAVVYEAFGQTPTIQTVSAPTSPAHGVVIQVEASGLCRSDWHGWMGHDPDIRLPHVPGHEFAGVIAEVGQAVERWQIGDRVTVPFVCACGVCTQCVSGNHQVCNHQFQPGFTHWGSFAEYVAIDRAEVNLVRLPDALDAVTAASLGCRFATAFRAVVDQGRVAAGQWVAVHGCGGVGLSAIMIASALGAFVVAIDITDEKLLAARSVGAVATVNATATQDVVGDVVAHTGGGAHVSIDALGSPTTCFNSIANLRKRGKHIQIGLMLADHRQSPIPMDLVIAKELEILGSHGMQAYRYGAMLDLIAAGKLSPDKLVGKTISLQEAPRELVNMNNFSGAGVLVINKW
jgi:alcohol dehydrogenase